MPKIFRRYGRGSRAVAPAVIEMLEARQMMTATLRIVNYNIDADTTDFSNQPPNLEAVLEAIGNEHLNDNGVTHAQPIDVLALQEAANGQGNANAPTLASIVSALNGVYGANTYAFDTTSDPTTGAVIGNGPNALIYNTHTIAVISATPLGSASSGGAPRAPMQYLLQPVGFSAAAEFYVDVSHMKASTGSNNAGRRGIEASTIVNSLNSLGANPHVISLGDFNITGDSSEQTYKTLRLKFHDPANPAGNWVSNSSFANLLSESATNVSYRDDIQFVTPAADNNSGFPGLQLDAGSLSVFGNGGASSIFHQQIANSTANPGVFPDFTSSYRSSVLFAEESATDHLPVVADYDLAGLNQPQIGSLSANPTSVGAGFPVTLTANNVTPGIGSVSGVSFYRDSNGTPGLQIGSDTLIGTGAQNGVNWSVSASTNGLAGGTYTFFAVATDTSNNSSSPASTTVSVLGLPPYITPSNNAAYTWDASTGNLMLTSGTLTFTADQAASGDITDPLVNLTATGAGANVVFNTTQHIAGLILGGGATAGILSGAGAILTTSSLSVDAASSLDITTNKVVINYGNPANDPRASIVGSLTSGYNNGDWTGLGIRSSAAAASIGHGTRYTVGYADGNVDVGYQGNIAVANSFIVSYTIAGDATLDGNVIVDDLAVIAQNYNQSGRDYAHGNFVYAAAGLVGLADLGLIAQNYNKSIGQSAAALASSTVVMVDAGPDKILHPRRSRHNW